MTNKSFGFDGLGKFSPKSAKVDGSTQSEVDKVAEDLGFNSRQASVGKRKRKGVTKPTDQFNLRAHIEDINKFIEIAEKRSLSYRELFAELVRSIT